MASMDLNRVLDREETDTIVIRKEDPVTTTTTVTARENGYESECSPSSRSEEDVARSALEVEADAFTRFIERQRVETMFELRHLRLGERPVTGQPNRERIQTFLNNIQDHQQQNTRVSPARPLVPSAHTADIDALADRRCVSAALGSAGFRQDLENAIRRSIEIRTPRQIPPAPPMPSVAASIRSDQNPPSAPPLRQAPVIRERARPQMTSTPRHEPLNIERQELELNAWDTITQLQREMIVLEISDLVHRQLVSSALESDFRTHLENSVLIRFRRGTPTEQNQQTAPPNPPVPTPVRTAPAARSIASTDGELSSRLDNMQRTLQLMFNMQIDMQRSIRQEVASALANTSSANTTIPASQPMNAGRCTICLSAIADTVLYRCGHLCVCYVCGLNLREATATTGVKCPICRAPVDDILRVYRSSRDGE